MTPTLKGISVLWLGLWTGLAGGQEGDRSDWLRDPALGNYRAYAEFKMANYAAARTVWETLAEVGNGDALFNLGVLAEDGLGEARDMNKAEALYTSAATSGNFKAQYRLGLLYATGELLGKNPDKARHFLGQAAQAGDQDAADMLAAMDSPDAELTPFQQAERLSSEGRHAQAAARYAELAQAGHITAQTRLAWMYEAGRGVEQNLAEAARRFAQAAEAGDADAQYALAVMFRTGRGQTRSLPDSQRWLRLAAEQGHPAAVAALASGRSAGTD